MGSMRSTAVNHVTDPAAMAFVLIPLGLVTAFVCGVWTAWSRTGASAASSRRAVMFSAAGAIAWMGITWAVARSGVLREWDRTPPPFAVLVLSILVLSAAIAYSRVGRYLALGLPLWLLVAVQGFRLPLELAMHGMYERGIMPPEMSYSGRNFDIVTGTTAIVVAILVARGYAGRGLVTAWNILGLALLFNVVVVAILGTPRFRYFGDDHLNVWVTYPPYVWLPAIMVLAALAGHLVIFRALLLSRPSSGARRPTA
jgi:hypothetical protein